MALRRGESGTAASRAQQQIQGNPDVPKEHVRGMVDYYEHQGVMIRDRELAAALMARAYWPNRDQHIQNTAEMWHRQMPGVHVDACAIHLAEFYGHPHGAFGPHGHPHIQPGRFGPGPGSPHGHRRMPQVLKRGESSTAASSAQEQIDGNPDVPKEHVRDMVNYYEDQGVMIRDPELAAALMARAYWPNRDQHQHIQHTAALMARTGVHVDECARHLEEFYGSSRGAFGPHGHPHWSPGSPCGGGVGLLQNVHLARSMHFGHF